MKTAMTLSVLLLSIASATPSFANYFHNPYMGLNLSIGSAPNPTPRDLRENRMPRVGRPAPQAAGASAKGYVADTKPPQRVAAK
jgi:hypothetical protein